ncbi:MAG TPA: hypothetical protein VME40_17055 [Caulobacteraceae bacterium]|nr:hypothetical protein [Caulobacteraceae bacterium]
MVDKRRRNARPSKYRPRTEAQKTRRRDLWEARAEERAGRRRLDLEADLRARYEALETALREGGQDGVHKRRHVRPLDDIQDEAERFAVLKARVERLEALWSVSRRKRETRGKIIIGGALLAELIDAVAAGDRELLTLTLDILDRRVASARDRLTVRDLLGDAPLPLRPGGDPADPLDLALAAAAAEEPDFDALVASAMAEEAPLRGADVDPDYAGLEAG